MHLKEGEIRAYQDHELNETAQQRVRDHLNACDSCRKRAEDLARRAEIVGGNLKQLAPDSPEAQPPIRVLRARLAAYGAQKERPKMWNKLFNRKYRPVWATATLIILLVIALSFPQVRALASSFLGLFRVERIEAVEVGMNINDFPDSLEDEFVAVERVLGSNTEVEQNGSGYDVADAAEASAAAGFQVRLPTTLASFQRITFQPEADLSITIDRDLWQALLNDLEYDFKIPKVLDGEKIVLHVPPTVTSYYGTCVWHDEQGKDVAELDQSCTIFSQMPSPSIEAPAGLDINLIGELYLQAVGMSPEEATRYSEQTDWATTLVIPVPDGAEYRNVTVDGVSGKLFEDKRAGKSQYTLIWIKDDILYAIVGQDYLTNVIRAANSLE
jgi:hypothetical protein